MTDRFDRVLLDRLSRLSRQARTSWPARISRPTAEEKAVGVGVGAVLAGAVGLAALTPVAAGTAAASANGDAEQGRAEQAAAVSHKVTKDRPRRSNLARARTEALKEGYAVPPRLVKPEEVIKLAEGQVGTREDRRGETKYSKWYVSTPTAKRTAARDGGFNVKVYSDAAWCDMFVSWLGAHAGVKNMGWDAYTVQHARWLQQNRRWGTKARPGAIVFFDWKDGSRGGINGIDHVGLVVKDNGNGTVSTIEGNTSNAVERRVRSKSSIVGYGYPEYAR